MNHKCMIELPKYISHETIDGETIVINLESGSYYSLEHTASTVWNLLVHHCDLDDIKRRLITHYKAEENIIEEDLNTFLQSLLDEGLITMSDKEECTHNAIDPITFSNAPYEKLALNKYTDMEDLLLLDPIHETDETGWPHQLAEDSAKL